MSIRGGPNLTPNKREQIDQFVKQQRRMTLRRQRRPLQRVPSSAAASAVRPSTPEPAPAVSSEEGQETESNMSEMADEHDEGDDEAEFQSFLLSGLEEVAKDSMLNQEFAKAQSMLEEAIQRRTGSTSEDAEFKQLQIQLAICYFAQHKWQLAEPLIDSIAKSKANFDPVVCNLLHALAIANAAERRFEKAITVCKQALQGKRRLKRDFGDASEKECNETLGLLATIHDLHGNRLDAEALRRKLSNGFSYYHPENELEFIVNHPKLCAEVFGKKLALDWRRPQIPATNLGVIAELIADLPSKTFLAPIKEEESSKKNKTPKKPLQTFHTKLSLYERLNTDSAKEVVSSSSTSASGNDEYLSTYWNRASGGSSRPGVSPKRSFTRRVVRFFGTRPATSGDNWSTHPTPGTEEIHSPSRPKFGKGFWSKSDSQLFKLKKSKTRPPKTASHKADSNSFSFLRAVGQQRRLLTQRKSSSPPAYEGPGERDPRPWRFSADTWLRLSSGYHHNLESHYPGLFPDGSNHWVPASRILEEEEQSHPVELADTSVARCWSTPVNSIEKTTPPMAPRPKMLRWRAAVTDDYREYRGGDSVKPPSIKVKDSQRLPNNTHMGQKLTVTIPKFGRNPESIPLVAHHPAETSKAPIVESIKGTEARPTPSVASSSSLAPTTPTKTEIIAKVLNDFKGDDTDELAVKERLERDFDEFMRRESQGEFNRRDYLQSGMLTLSGLWVGGSGGRQAWVPASYFKDLNPVPTTAGVSVDPASQDSQERDSGLRQATPFVSSESEIDEFSRGFHDAIAHRMRKAEVGRDLPKPRYQLVDETVGEASKSLTKLERAQKRPSMPKLPPIDKTQLSERKASVSETHVESRSISPSLPPQQLGRKFSWETVFEEDSISTVPTETGPKPTPPPLLQLNVLNRKFSWISDDTPETPDLVRSSSLSSSSSSSISSVFSASTSISSTSTGPMLKFDPAMKDLIIVGHESSPSLSESQNLDDILEQLSAAIIDRKSKRTSAKTLSPSSKLEVDLMTRQDDKPTSVDTKGGVEQAKSLQTKPQASAKLQALPFIRHTDIFQRMMEEEWEKEKTVASGSLEGMLNRRHPLRASRKQRKMKREAAIVQLDEEKRMLYPEGVSSLGALSIEIAI